MDSQHRPALRFHPPGRGAVYGPGRASGYCIGHYPGAMEALRKCGHAKSRAERTAKLLPARLQPKVSLLEDALGEVHRGELDSRAASAMASLAGPFGADYHGRGTGRTIAGA